MAYLLAALGGALGALARWGVGHLLPSSPGDWPWATLTVNLTGCLLIGVLLAVLPARFPRAPWLRPLLATGVLGGFTPFSAFSLDVVLLWDRRQAGLAVAYVLVSVAASVGGLVLALRGMRQLG